jgi:hypothetical protein
MLEVNGQQPNNPTTVILIPPNLVQLGERFDVLDGLDLGEN